MITLPFSSKKVLQQFSDSNVVLFKADWTQKSDDITQALNSYGRASVPLYVIHYGDNLPVFLPELLIPQTVIKALTDICTP